MKQGPREPSGPQKDTQRDGALRGLSKKCQKMKNNNQKILKQASKHLKN